MGDPGCPTPIRLMVIGDTPLNAPIGILAHTGSYAIEIIEEFGTGRMVPISYQIALTFFND